MRQIAVGDAHQLGFGFVLSGKADFIDCEWLDERIERVKNV